MREIKNLKPKEWYEEYQRIIGRSDDEIEEEIEIAKQEL